MLFVVAAGGADLALSSRWRLINMAVFPRTGSQTLGVGGMLCLSETLKKLKFVYALRLFNQSRKYL